jgi:hypothetical protein
MLHEDFILDGLIPRAKSVLRNAVKGPLNAATVGSLTRSYLLATPGCGPIIADQIIAWARRYGITIPAICSSHKDLRMTVKELIELLAQQDQEALVLKYQDGRATPVEGIDIVNIAGSKPAVLIE